jgi:hypothetical protein
VALSIVELGDKKRVNPVRIHALQRLLLDAPIQAAEKVRLLSRIYEKMPQGLKAHRGFVGISGSQG